jgi:hypothetical protein
LAAYRSRKSLAFCRTWALATPGRLSCLARFLTTWPILRVVSPCRSPIRPHSDEDQLYFLYGRFLNGQFF